MPASQSVLSVDEQVQRPRPAWVAWVPLAGVFAFAALYLGATALYPSAALANPGAGYPHLQSYWCDLLRAVAPSGEVNPGRPLALLATWILPLSLVPFWLALPTLFQAHSRFGLLVQVTGCVAMFGATLIWTPLHDQVLNLVAVCGFTAWLGTLLCVDRTRHRALIWGTAVAGGLTLTNYTLWATAQWVEVIPTVQKLAFIALFVWIGQACAAMRGVASGKRRVPVFSLTAFPRRQLGDED